MLEHNPKPEDVKTLTIGERWDLPEGYSVISQSIAPFASPPTARLVLYKNGIEVKNSSVQQGEVFNYTREIAGETDVTVFATYLDKVYTDVLFLKYSWLISDNAIVIQAGDRFGKLRVTAAGDNEIVLKNDATMTLTKDSIINIMGGLNFKVADNDNLRYYPFVELTNPGIYEIRGTVTNTTYVWNAHNYAGFFYDFNGEKWTETLNVSLSGSDIIPVDNMIYKTHPVTRDYQVYKNKNMLVNGDSNYSLIPWQGKRYIAIKGKANKLVDLLLEHTSRPDDTKVLTVGERWDLPDGKSLMVQSISLIESTPTARLVFYNNGIEVENKSVAQGEVFNYTKEIASEPDVTVFSTYIDKIYTTGSDDIVHLNYNWLISENAMTVKNDDIFGKLKVTSASDNELVLKNNVPITLSGESIIDIMNGLKFKVNNNMRYYPFVTVNVTGTTFSTTNNVCASLCHNYNKRLDRSVDFYPWRQVSLVTF